MVNGRCASSRPCRRCRDGEAVWRSVAHTRIPRGNDDNGSALQVVKQAAPVQSVRRKDGV